MPILPAPGVWDAVKRGSQGYVNNWKTGLYYDGHMSGSTTTTGAATAGRLYANPFIASYPFVADRISFNVTTLVAASTARLGIYAANAIGEPGALVLDAGSVATTSTGIKELTIAQTLPPGLWFLAVWVSHAISTTSVTGAAARPTWGPTTANTGPSYTFFTDGAFSSALPNPFGTVGSQSGSPLVFLRST